MGVSSKGDSLWGCLPKVCELDIVWAEREGQEKAGAVAEAA